jgi:hypothetical protein
MVVGGAGEGLRAGHRHGSQQMRLKGILTTAVLVAGAVILPGCGSDVQTAGFVTSGDCPREQALVRRALDRTDVRVDVDGDGRLDRVAVASDPKAVRPCRGFVGVRVQGGSTYSTHLFPLAVPVKGLPAKILGLPHLGDRPGAQIVVDTRAAVDSVLAQLFTLADGSLQAVPVPGFRDRTFIVEGGGVIYPRGAACTADGRMVVSKAAQTRDGKRYRVTRSTYDVRGEPLRLVDPAIQRSTPRVDRLLVRFPEFGSPHWKACEGAVL